MRSNGYWYFNGKLIYPSWIRYTVESTSGYQYHMLSFGCKKSQELVVYGFQIYFYIVPQTLGVFSIENRWYIHYKAWSRLGKCSHESGFWYLIEFSSLSSYIRLTDSMLLCDLFQKNIVMHNQWHKSLYLHMFIRPFTALSFSEMNFNLLVILCSKVTWIIWRYGNYQRIHQSLVNRYRECIWWIRVKYQQFDL